jgi:membrane protease YdiL (CAAX protease family)
MSWGYWIPVASAGGHWSHFPGLTGPLIAATIVTALTTGSTGLSDLGARMGRWRIAPRWYAACLVPVAAALVALAALAAVGASVPSMAELSHMPGLPELGWLAVFALVVLVNGYGEEPGWRGFAWTPLRQRHTLAGAALLLAVPWALRAD